MIDTSTSTANPWTPRPRTLKRSIPSTRTGRQPKANTPATSTDSSSASPPTFPTKKRSSPSRQATTWSWATIRSTATTPAAGDLSHERMSSDARASFIGPSVPRMVEKAASGGGNTKYGVRQPSAAFELGQHGTAVHARTLRPLERVFMSHKICYVYYDSCHAGCRVKAGSNAQFHAASALRSKLPLGFRPHHVNSSSSSFVLGFLPYWFEDEGRRTRTKEAVRLVFSSSSSSHPSKAGG